MAAPTRSDDIEANVADQANAGPDINSPWYELYKGKPFDVKSFFPPLVWVPQYIRSVKGELRPEDQSAMGKLPFSLKGDSIAGLTVGVMLVPQCLAFALLAGLPIQAGLYSSFLPLITYACFGTLRQVQMGPTALMSLISGQALDSLGITDPAGRMAGAALMALFVGLISLLLGALRFGNVVHFMSHSVLAAFCTAAGITIATSQIKHVLGVKLPRTHYWWETVKELLINLPEIHWPTFFMGMTILALLLTLKYWKSAGSADKRQSHRIWRFFPKDKTSIPFRTMKLVADLSSLFAVVLGALWAWVYRAAGEDGVKLVGEVDAEGLIAVLPGQGHFDQLLGDTTLIVSAAMIAVIGFLETVAVGSKFAGQYKYSYDPNQELVALGLSNVASAFMSGFPVTGGFSRTAVNVTFGATSLLSDAISSTLVLGAVYLLLPAIAKLPLASMAPIIIQGAIVFIDIHEFKVAFHSHRREFVVMLATLLTCLALTVKEGLLVGFIFSVLKTLLEIGNPNLAVCVRVKENWRDIRYFPNGEEVRNAVVVRMDAQMHFANATTLKDFCVEAIRVREALGDNIEYLVIDGKSINRIDLSACSMLEDMCEALASHSQKLVFTNLKAPTAHLLVQAGVHERVMKTGGHLILDMAEAIAIISSESPDFEGVDEQVKDLVRTKSEVLKSQSKSSFTSVDNKTSAKPTNSEEICSPRQVIATVPSCGDPAPKQATKIKQAELPPLAVLARDAPLAAVLGAAENGAAVNSGDARDDGGEGGRSGGRGGAERGRCGSGFGVAASMVGCFGPVNSTPGCSSFRARGGSERRH